MSLYGYPVTFPMVVPQPTEIGTPRPGITEVPDIQDAGTKGLRILTGASASKEIPELPNISKPGVPEPYGPSRINADALAQAEYNRDLSISTDRFKAMQKFSKRIAKARDKNQDQRAKYFNQGGYYGRARSGRNEAIRRAKAWRSAAYGMRPDARQYLTNL